MILTNARLISPDGIRDGLEVIVEEGKIAEIRPPAPRLRRTGEQTRTSSKDVIDLNGNYLAPGFIDLHVHGALGRDTMDSSAEAFRTICDFHASGGTTSLLLTTATAPMDNIVDVLKAVRSYRSPIGAVAGVHIEGPFISKAKCGV
jgi:N-acetylglucosamine-6-phosphate deacetylase